MSYSQRFKQSMKENGIPFNGEIIENGEIHRFHVDGDNTNSKNGWYVFYSNNTPSGAYGCWKRNTAKTWCAKDKSEMSYEEWDKYTIQIDLAKQKIAKEKEEAQKKASLRAQQIWKSSLPANNAHPYLKEKKILAHTSRYINGNLLIPISNKLGDIQSLQYINSEGRKKFLRDGAIKGNYHLIGDINNSSTIGIGEGFSTCATINEIMGYPIYCAFNCGNLLEVAKSVREKHPNANIIIFADNDQWPNIEGLIKNHGIDKANEAAEAIRARVVCPNFTNLDVKNKPTDFNDLMQLSDTEVVREQIVKLYPIAEWSDPQPIKNELLSVEPLLPELIPKQFRDFIVDVSERMQCAIDFPAISLLTVVSILVGTGCGIQPKQNDDWLVIPNLWGCVIGRPGIMKSPAVSEAISFLDKLQSESKKEYDQELKKYQNDQRVYEIKRKSIEKEIERSVNKSFGGSLRQSTKPSLPQAELEILLYKLEPPKKPIWNRYKTNDSTIEKLLVLVSENPRGILVYRDELIGLLRSFDKIGHETDRAFYLESWTGNASHNSDRIERGATYAENVCISILGTTQPDKLSKYLFSAMNGDNDGLIQRFQLMVYPNDTNWKLVDKKPDVTARTKVFEILKRLTQMNFISQGATCNEDDKFPSFHFDIQAQEIFNQWIADLEEKKLRDSDYHPLLVEHLSKFRSLMPSLALIFHLIEIASTEDDNQSKTISSHNAALACAWCDYLESHAKRIYNLISNSSIQSAEILAKKIQNGSLQNNFTSRDIKRKNWSLLNKKELVEEALLVLIEMGWLKKTASSQNRTTYLINPNLKRKKPHE